MEVISREIHPSLEGCHIKMASFTLKGIESLQSRIKGLEESIKDNARRAANEDADRIRDLSKEYCPEDDTVLVDSIRVDQSDVGQGRNALGQFNSEAVAVISITAGGSDVPHALAVHEHPSKHDPPSWEGVEVHFRKGGPKFLERAMKDISSGMLQRLGNKILK